MWEQGNLIRSLIKLCCCWRICRRQDDGGLHARFECSLYWLEIFVCSEETRSKMLWVGNCNVRNCKTLAPLWSTSVSFFCWDQLWEQTGMKASSAQIVLFSHCIFAHVQRWRLLGDKDRTEAVGRRLMRPACESCSVWIVKMLKSSKKHCHAVHFACRFLFCFHRAPDFGNGSLQFQFPFSVCPKNGKHTNRRNKGTCVSSCIMMFNLPNCSLTVCPGTTQWSGLLNVRLDSLWIRYL